MTHKVGYGNWDALKAEVRNQWKFRFNWMFKSKSALELSRRVDTLIRLIEKELAQKPNNNNNNNNNNKNIAKNNAKANNNAKPNNGAKGSRKNTNAKQNNNNNNNNNNKTKVSGKKRAAENDLNPVCFYLLFFSCLSANLILFKEKESCQKIIIISFK